MAKRKSVPRALMCAPTGSELPWPGEMFIKSIQRMPWRAFAGRLDELYAVRTPAQWRKRRAQLAARLRRAWGPFPKRTPLKARVTGRIKKRGYVIEKIVYQSVPGLHVTANLYLPDPITRPVPGVICPIGHWQSAKVEPQVQARGHGLALKGYAALLYDTIGQGERCAYVDPRLAKKIPWRDGIGVFKNDFSPLIGQATHEHTYCGLPCFLTGRSLATFMVNEGFRAVDYLSSRPEVDARRIACTGASGGGTLTHFITPLEPRIKVSVPVCAVGVMESGWASPMGGGGDAEQNIPRAVVDHLTSVELIAMAAPRPVLVIREAPASSLVGTNDACEQARHVYRVLGAEERLQHTEYDSPHEYNREMREQLYGWLNRFFGRKDASPEEPDLEIEEPEALLCTPSGHVAVSIRSARSVFDINAAYARSVVPKRKPVKSRAAARKRVAVLREATRKGTGYEPPAEHEKTVELGHAHYQKLSVEKLAIHVSRHVYLPALLAAPRSGDRFVICAHEDGKAAAFLNGDARALVGRGLGVLAVDVRGTGETTSRHREAHASPDRHDGIRAWLMGHEGKNGLRLMKMGRSHPGLRAADLVRAAAWLRRERGASVVGLCTRGRASIYGLIASGASGCFDAVAASGGLVSYLNLATSRYYRYHFENYGYDFLPNFDLPDAAAATAPSPLLLSGLLDAMKNPASRGEVARAYKPVRDLFRAMGAAGAVRIQPGKSASAKDTAGWMAEVLSGEW